MAVPDKYVIWIYHDGTRRYYTGSNGRESTWHPDIDNALQTPYGDAKRIAEDNDAEYSFADMQPQGCVKCSNKHIRKTCYGDLVCCGCGMGVRSHLYTGAGPLSVCSQCGASIYTAELFRGPVCPKCGHWC